MMNVRECYNRVVRFERADYIPNFEFGPIQRTMIDDWKRQGMPADADFAGYFGIHRMEDYIHVGFGPIPGVPGQGRLFEDGARELTRDAWGRELERPKAGGMAEGARHVVRPGVRDRADWDRIKGHFRADEPKRYPDHWDENKWCEMVARWTTRDWPLALRGPSMVGEIKEVMGFENFAVSLYEDPGLVEEIMETRTQLALDILDRAFREVRFDVFHFWEDIAFNNGPILSPEHFEKLAVPRYRRLADFFRCRGGEIVSVDSDGDIRKLIPGWLRGGVNHIWPMETNAGMDVVALRKEYGQAFSMRGGFNKYVLREGRDAIDRELARIAPVVQEGGYIPHADHQIPNGVTFDNFSYYMEQKRKLLG